MGKAKLGSWWAAGAAVCMLVSAGVAAQSTAPADPVGAPAPAAEPGPAAAPASAAEPAPGGAPEAVAPAPAGAPAATRPAPVAQSRYNERGGGDQAALTALHRQNRQTMADAADRPAAGNDGGGPRSRHDHHQQHGNRGRQDDELRAAAGDERRGDPARRRRAAERRADPGRPGQLAAGSIRRRLRGEDGGQLSGGARSDPEGAGPGARAGDGADAPGDRARPPARAGRRDVAGRGVADAARPALQFPGEPAGVSRTNTGIDTRRGVAP